MKILDDPFTHEGRFRFVLPTLIVLLGVIFIILTAEVITHKDTPLFLLILSGWIIFLALILFLGFAVYVTQNRWTQMSQRLDTLEALHQTALDIVSQLDQDQVLNAIARRAVKYIRAGVCFVGQYDPEKDVLRIMAQSDAPPNLIGLEISTYLGVAGEVFRSGRPFFINDYQNWENHVTSMTTFDSFLGVPLKWQGTVIGVLSIGAYRKKRSFTDFDAWLLGPFADLASIAINNARMFAEEKKLTAQLAEREAVKTRLLAETENKLAYKAIQLQGLLKRMTQLQEEERTRIARDMHDSTTQLILGAVYATQAALQGLDHNDLVSTRENIGMVRLFLRQIEGEIRETIWNLRPMVLDDQGFVPTIKRYIDEFSSLTGIECAFQLEGQSTVMSEERELAVFRIIQETMKNTFKHANAHQVTVSLHYTNRSLQVVVTDNGRGFNLSELAGKSKAHFGLIGMRERAESIGASFVIQSHPGKGTRMILAVPITDPVSLEQ